MDDRETMNAVSTQNVGYLTPSALQMRLETDSKIEAVECFLSGYKTFTLQNERGNVIVEKKKVGKRLMNNEGVAHVTNYVASVINPQTVQGNYSEEWYRQQLELTHKRLSFMITVNRVAWDIDIYSRYSIIGFIMEFVKPFMSRLLDNEERKSYASTIRSVESSTMHSGQSMAERFGVSR